ncbi:MAG: tetratricopeptide repeat protein [Epsilonproteobacteria bacterium]|nr:hypothetical protein [Campylobacterota bacterium]NPA56684.1 tetratricopeptide repeat protein [Campylobacterota bacterium]
MHRLLITLFLAATLWGAGEPSVFEAGDLDNPNPYGLTPTEKHILKNSQAIKEIKKQLFTLQEQINTLSETVEGLKSVVEGLDQRINNLEKSDKRDLEERITRLRGDLNSSIEVQKENYNQIEGVLKKLTALIDKIDASYISRREFRREIERIYSHLNGGSGVVTSGKSGAQLYREGRQAYKRGEYAKARELFLASAAKHYKPAASNFYAGESCYYQKEYSCAVDHYKKSASLYQNASYMPTLLLHTAISLDRLGDKEEAKKFYESVLKLYPDSKAAEIAKKNLKKL